MSISTDQIKKLEEMGFDWTIGGSTFDERLKELAAYKAGFGNCNAPETPSSPYYSLGKWCVKMRGAFNQIQEGKTPKMTLTHSGIAELIKLGFRWDRSTNTFESRFAELVAFKEKFGNCRVSHNPSNKYHLLGNWVTDPRKTYNKKFRKGKSSANHPLNPEQIKRLEDLGFEWSRIKTFDQRFADLTAFKAEHGH